MLARVKQAKLTVLVALAVILGVGAGVNGAKYFGPQYSPISHVSVGVVQNTVPGVEGAALVAGSELEYTHAICLDKKDPTRVRVTGRWRQYEPVAKTAIVDPFIDHIEIILPPGCERPDTKQILPAFITPGVWALELEIVAKSGSDHQTVQLITTRFTVLPKP